MKSRRFVLFVVLMSLATVAFAQSDAHKMDASKTPVPKSEAQTSFDAMKTLAGDWEGPVTTDMPVEAKVDIAAPRLDARNFGGNVPCTSSRGRNAADPAYDHPVTMLYVDVDADRLTLVHATREPVAHDWQNIAGRKDSKFDFADLPAAISTDTCTTRYSPSSTPTITPRTGPTCCRGKPVHAHIDLQRAK
jgi:hypothetical protein